MAYQKILDQKQSTYGSPYCIYTVEVEPTNRTTNGVTLNIRVSSHLKYSDSYFGSGTDPETGDSYYLTGHLTVLKTDIPITIKKATDNPWSGTAVHTATASKSFSNIASTTTKLTATFSVTSGVVSDKASGLNTTTCSNIDIGAAPAHGIHIDNGSSISAYRCYIDNGSTWVEYIPYIDNGTSFVKY